MAVVAISVKCLAMFVLIAFLQVALSDGCNSDADCDRFFDEFCCNKKCVRSTSDCCSKDSDCFDGESCCNYKCKLDCDNGHNFKITYILLGAFGVFVLIILVASCFQCYRGQRRRLRYVIVIDEDCGEITVPNNSNNTACARPPSYQQGYPSALPPNIPSTTARKPCYGAVQAAAHQ